MLNNYNNAKSRNYLNNFYCHLLTKTDWRKIEEVSPNKFTVQTFQFSKKNSESNIF